MPTIAAVITYLGEAMTIVRAPRSLDQWTVAYCCTPNPTAPLTIDLTNCEFIRPAGLVFLGTAMQMAAAAGREVRMTLGPERDVTRYAERMGLAALAVQCGARGDSFPQVRHNPPDDRFVQLTAFGGQGQCDSVIDDVCGTLLARAQSWPVDRQELHNAVFELGVNVEQHAQSSGLVAVQHLSRRRCVEFAVGDFGIGIPGSLKAAGRVYSSDVDAIRSAVETDATCQATQGRGAGLPGLLDFLVSDDVGGHLVVQSLQGRVVYRHGRPSMSIRTATPTYRWAGTMVFGTLSVGGR